MADVESLSEKQRAALDSLRLSLEDIWRSDFEDDHYLLRWLRARQFDIKKAEKMLRTHIAWRKEVGADTILEDYKPNEVLEQYFPGGFCGHSKEGFPCWIDPTGYCDIKGIVKSVSTAEILRKKIHLFEYLHRVLLPQRSAEEGKRIDRSVLIFDLENYGMKHLWRPGLEAQLEIIRMMEANYPEQMGTCFVVNSPGFFPALFQVLKPCLHENTQKKLVVLGSNDKTLLLKYFHPDCLPARYGGNLRDPDGSPDCRTWINFGGEVPSEFYITCDRQEMESHLVARGSTLKIEQAVKQEGTELSWEFVTDNHDIGFGVYFKVGDSDNVADWEVLVGSQRVNCHITPQRGSLLCSKLGTYVIQFDNSYSWLRSKFIWFRVFTSEEASIEADEQKMSIIECEMSAAKTGDDEEEELFTRL